MRTLFAVLVCIAFITTGVSIIEGKIIRVPGDYEEVWAAARFAEGGDIIQVAPGVYEESMAVVISPHFMKNPGPVTLQGAGAEATTIIGIIAILGDDEVKRPFKIDGFRVEGGIEANRASIIISHNFITNSPPDRLGRASGGIALRYNSSHKIRIEENIIKNTSSGIRCEGNDEINGPIKADVLIVSNIIENNEAGISCKSTSPKIRKNRIVGNKWGVNIREATPDMGTHQDRGRNTIYKNREYDIQNITDEIISAEYNYWGDPGGPKKGGIVFLNLRNGWIDYEPWLVSDQAWSFSVQPQRKLLSTWGRMKAGR